MADVKQILIEIDLQTGNVVGGTEQVNKQLRSLSANAKLATTEINKASAAMQKNLAGSAGIAGAAATELGRTISDLPFGITAVTNNISQLGNMFALLVTSAGGVSAALTAMRTALMGPVGILVAFQAAVAGIELWAQSQRRAKKDTDDLKKSIDEINKTFGEQQSILDALGRAAIYSPEARAALAENMKEVKAFLEAAESTGDATAEVVDEAVRLGMNLLEARKNAAIVEKEYLELIKNTNLEESERISAGTELADAFRAVIAAENALNIQRQEGVTLTGDLVKATREQVDALKSLERISFALGRDAGGETIFESLFPLLRDDDGKVVGVVAGQAAKRLIKIGETATDEFQKWAKKTESAREGEGNWFLDNLGISEEKLTGALDQVKQGLSSLNEILNAQAQREMDIEEAKTIAQNDALRSRLRNEQLSAEQRDAINQQISRNEAKLIEEQNKMKEKAFKRDKAFRISMGLIDTASSTLKAFGSQIIPGDPTSLVRAKIAAKLAAVFGLAQVAAIASQSFVPQASPSPNLTAQTPGGGAGAEPQFNVIGATGQNQLAAAIAATQQQPVKAYVVSNDVTTAQSLDRNIVAEASL
jgi:hypothetical protein